MSSIQQISVPLSHQQHRIVLASEVSRTRILEDYQRIQTQIERDSQGGFAMGFHTRMPPFNICVSSRFAQHIRETHDAMNTVLLDIVRRWTTDMTAGFSERMPIEPHEMRLMKWMNGEGRQYVGEYGRTSLRGDSIGIWRSDFLVSEDANDMEQIKFIEFNGRLPFNGTYIVGRHETAIQSLVEDSELLQSPNTFSHTVDAILEPFDGTKPLYLLREKWPGVDSPQVLMDFTKKYGQPTITVKPGQLRVRPANDSPTGFKLCCQAETESAEMIDIDQCCSELLQVELAVLDEQVLQQLATVCRMNDLRTTFLVHDKRILGIVQEELPELVSRNVITPEQKVMLQNALLDTLLPGTIQIQDLLQQSKHDPALKDTYIVKPVRDGNGAGIQLGKNIPQEEWLSILEKLSSHKLLPSEGAAVVQKLNEHKWFELTFLEQNPDDPQRNATKLVNLVGAQHMIHGVYQAFGPWRTAVDINLPMLKPAEIEGMVQTCVIRPEDWDGNSLNS